MAVLRMSFDMLEGHNFNCLFYEAKRDTLCFVSMFLWWVDKRESCLKLLLELFCLKWITLLRWIPFHAISSQYTDPSYILKTYTCIHDWKKLAKRMLIKAVATSVKIGRWRCQGCWWRHGTGFATIVQDQHITIKLMKMLTFLRSMIKLQVKNTICFYLPFLGWGDCLMNQNLMSRGSSLAIGGPF